MKFKIRLASAAVLTASSATIIIVKGIGRQTPDKDESMKQLYVDSKSFYKKNIFYEFMDGIKSNNPELYPTCCGRQVCMPDYSYGPVIRMEYLIHYVSRGKGCFYMNDKIYDLRANQIFFIPPGIPHYYCSDYEDPWEYLWLGFSGERAFDYAGLAGLSLEQPVSDLLVPGHLLTELIDNLLKARYFSLADELDRIGYVYRFLSLLAKSHRASQPNTNAHNRLTECHILRAQEYIEHNYHHMTITDLAEHLNISRTHVHNLFKKFFFLSPQQYLICYRLKLAAGLLKNSRLPVQEVAYSVGYKDASTFSKVFKKHYGTSPHNYRREIELSDDK